MYLDRQNDNLKVDIQLTNFAPNLEIHELLNNTTACKLKSHTSTLVSQLGSSPALAKFSQNAADQLQLHLQPIET